MDNANIEVQYIDRVKHTYSHQRTNDDDLAYAKTIADEAESIVIQSKDDATTVTVETVQGVYHFSTFRADYVGHASRNLVKLLEHFRVSLPLEFLVAHKSLTIYLTGQKIIIGETEYKIELRNTHFELVEPVEWLISSAILDVVYRLADKYKVQPVEFVESATGFMFSAINLADQYQVSMDEIMETLTSMTAQNKVPPTNDEAFATGESVPS